MLNPDFPAKKFCEKGYEEVRSLCQNITLFADQVLIYRSLTNS
jgi:hypothetical protein